MRSTKLFLPGKYLKTKRLVSVPRNVRTIPTSVQWNPDFHVFREMSEPILKAGYAGALVYFALQWRMYRNINQRVEEAKQDDDQDNRKSNRIDTRK